MRILVISHEYPPLGTGAANALRHLLPRWADAGAEVTLLTSHWNDLPQKEEQHGVRIVRARVGRKKQVAPSAGELLRFLWGARTPAARCAARFQPQVAVGFFTLPGGLLARRVARREKTPYVVALRGSDVPGYDNKRFGGTLRLTKPWVRSIWKEAAAVVPNSAWLAELAARTAPEVHFEVIPNGVEAAQFTAARSRQAADGRTRVLYVGQLVERKGVDLLIEALAGETTTTLSIVGDGPCRPALERLAAGRGLDGRVAFHGLLDKPAVVEQMKKADLLALPTSAEGMSNVILEAMAAGLPVLTTPAGAADLVTDGQSGLVVERTVSAIETGLRRLSDPQLRQSMGERAAVAVASRSWDAVAGRWLQLLGRVVTGRQLLESDSS